MVSMPELSTAWREVQEHDRRRFEVADAVGFADGGTDGRDWWGGPWAAEGRLHRPTRIPKTGGGTRVLCVLDPAVQARFRALVARVAPAIERCLAPSVVSGRRVPRSRGLDLEPWTAAWRRHARAVEWLGRRSAPLLRMDVRDFFGSVEHEPLCEALTRAGADRGAVERLGALLRRLAADGVRGLPVGPEPSAVLANLALVEADRTLSRLRLPFVRWCDDVTIGLGRRDPAEAAEAWAAALGRHGLRPAPEKSRLIEPGEALVASGGGSLRARLGSTVRRRSGAGNALTVLERAAAIRDEPDPHSVRRVVGALALAGGREARLALRHVRVRFPEHAVAARWGLWR